MSFPRYKNYKKSGIEWVGEVPSHWHCKPLLSTVVESDRSNLGMVESNLLSLSYGAIVKKDINDNDGLLPESFETYQIVEPFDIVWRLTDLQNDKRSLRTAISRERGIITSAYLTTTPINIEPDYLNYLLRAYDLTKVFYSMGGGLRQSMKYSDVKRMPIPVPTEPEQIAIAAFLNHETGQIDALVEEQKRLIDLLKEKRQAIISRAVTKGLNPGAPMKASGAEWLGEVPAHWQLLRLKDVCIEIVDCKNRTPPQSFDESYFVARTSCIRDGKFDPSGGYYTDEESFEEWTRKGQPQIGDILFTREAPTGEACLYPEGYNICLGQRTMFLRPNRSLATPEFILATIYGPLVRHQIEAKSKGSTVGHLRVGEVGELPFLLPPLDEQLEISANLKSLEREFSSLVEACWRSVLLLQERRATLISAAVTGKIDVRELFTDDTHAPVLETIRETVDA